jgi:hypothetical protein
VDVISLFASIGLEVFYENIKQQKAKNSGEFFNHCTVDYVLFFFRLCNGGCDEENGFFGYSRKTRDNFFNIKRGNQVSVEDKGRFQNGIR